ncbi:uncharacterized protein N7469_007669 [Penicillium citrinum]|uniref:Uncharacterized protein n=1 Tax=Penicillium citrinum TaxID=5077 RepID=A0A9W9TIK7_PENCI|nr:uncharacterized protein N7469_007669 [Penicillium citrinum]KAJ5224166.1 hypothetical protein N7469_007669 [Penicillium citrinum]
MVNEKNEFVIGFNRNISTLTSKHDGDVSGGNQWGEIVHEEDIGSSEKTTWRENKTRVFKKHWKRFWCCYLVAIVIFLAIFLPIFFLIAIPAIGQRIVDNTDLPIYGAEILDPKPNRISFTLHTSLKVPAGLRIHTDPLDLNLFNADTAPTEPYISVSLPAYNLKGKTDMTVSQNDTKILNQPEFIDTLTNAVYNDKFTLSAKGSTVGHLGNLKARLTLNKNVELQGLDKLRGFSIESARLLMSKDDNGDNILGTAILPNHSVFTFALGNVTLNLKSSDLVVGQATIQDVLLRPGDNKVSLRGILNMGLILENLEDIMEYQEEALRNGEIELSASGNSTTYNGVHIEYYEKFLNNLTLTTRVSILAVLGDTLQGLLDDSNSSIGDTLRNLTGKLGNTTLSK